MKINQLIRELQELQNELPKFNLEVVDINGKKVSSIEMVNDEELGDVYAIEFD